MGDRPNEVMCANCPFAPTGPGADLRRSLRPGRMAEIQQAVWIGATFYCHKTTTDDGWDDDGDSYLPAGKERVCGGAVRFQRIARENRERYAARAAR